MTFSHSQSLSTTPINTSSGTACPRSSGIDNKNYYDVTFFSLACGKNSKVTLEINNALTQDGFIGLVIQWNQTSPHPDNVIPDIKWTGERNIRYGTDALWLAIEEYRNKNIIAVRFEKKESTID